MERFVGPYKVKKIVLLNTVELKLPHTIKIHPVVNVSEIHKYVGQVEEQKKKQPAPVIIEGKEEQEIEKILNKQQIREKDKYLVRQKGFTAESNTWEGKENLRNAKEAIEKFEREYQGDIKEVNQQEKEEEIFERGELPGRFTAKRLFGWLDKRYDKEYWRRLERNWKRQKRGQPKRRRAMEMIREEEEIK